jgi:hypothetical protein
LQAAGLLAQIAKRRPLTPSEHKRMLAALQQARMACNAAGLVDKETQGSPKLEELGRLLEELCIHSNRKAVVFSQWALMTEMAETLVRGMGLGCVRLHGGVPSHKRGEMMERFQNDAALQVFISTDAGGTGLNLQAASVLINLDMPWNPAILDQRIARIHRLGQKHKVQIFILLAEDSYEQRVAQLVKGKRDLFDNVIDPAATEDAVGVSKKMLQTLIEDLAGASVDEDATAVPKGKAIKEEQAETDEAVVSVKLDSAGLSEDEKIARQVVEAIQAAFGLRIERVLAKAGGLLVVVDHWEDDDEQIGQDLSVQGLPVAVIDGRTWRSLQKLGMASPLAEAETIFETAVTEQPQVNPLSVLAAQKLHSVEVLLEQQCLAGVMDLLASALLMKLAALNNQTQVPAITDAAVWVYTEILPSGLLTPEQAALVVQVVSCSLASNLPDMLIQQAANDVRQLFSQMA